jgi:4-hydroxy-tetrahydrodipicolinate reductase
MGQRIVSALKTQGSCTQIAGYDQCTPENGILLDSMTSLFTQSDLVADFSHGSLFPTTLRAALDHPRPLLMGTTGMDPSFMPLLHDLSRAVPVMWAPNTSFGAAIQRWAAGTLAKFFPETYDIDIVEAHHRHKHDAPSGTAIALGQAISNQKKAQGVIMELGGTTSPRSSNRIEMHALRCGSIPFCHEVMWTSENEQITLKHSVFSGHTFASGALHLMHWLSEKKAPGLYTIEDVLGLT